MKISNVVAITLLCVALAVAQQPDFAQACAECPQGFISGADVSELQKLEDYGAVYRMNGKQAAPLYIFRQSRVTWMRLRLFVHPSGRGAECNDLEYTLSLAKKIKSQGLKLLLDFHYSDTWADPGKQYTPQEWRGLSHAALVAQVKSYTRSTIESFRRQHAMPDMVEIGNEITNGILWSDGRVSTKVNDPAQWKHLADLLKAGISGAAEGAVPDAPPLIMIHIDRGGDSKASRIFYDHLQTDGVPFDVIGLSDYPWWQGSLAQLKNNMNVLAARYHKPIIVVETSFPWAPQEFTEHKRVLSAERAEKKILHHAATPAGQAEYLRALIQTVCATPDHLGAGVFYWAAAWIKTPGWGAPSWSGDWEHRALFDEHANALPALKVFGECCTTSK